MGRFGARWLSRLRHVLPTRRHAGGLDHLHRHPDAASLADHTRHFRRCVEEVVPGVHVAIGFGLANSILIQGTDGRVIVDTLESDAVAAIVRRAFDEICPLPVRALVYTHNHADHVFGARAMAGDDQPEVFAHESTRACILHIASVVRPAIFTRSMRQFGTCLEPGELLNAGIGPFLGYDATTSPSVLWPTTTFADALETRVAGVRMVLRHVPGETPDQICVWLPEARVLIPGDNFYHAFPNLYAIRGTAYRDVMDWVRSLDEMISLDAEHLVPCHGRPIHGAREIRETLTNYRDAIQFVHDQTVRAMNLGMTPDEIVQVVRLPRHLAEQPYLQEHYGRVAWAVRSIFQGYLGWFDGDAASLHRLSPRDRGMRMIELAGGIEPLLRSGQAAVAGDPRWAAEIAGFVLAVHPTHAGASRLRAEALRALGLVEPSASGRNYLLTQAREADGSLSTPRGDPKVSAKNLLPILPMADILRGMAVSLDGPSASDIDVIVGLRFVDTGEDWTLHVRHGVAVTTAQRPGHADARLETQSIVWKEMLTGARNPALALAGSEVRIEGSRAKLLRCLLLFRPSD